MDQNSHSGLIAVITGAARGIGAATAAALAEAGASVAIVDVRPATETVELIAAAGGSAIEVTASITNPDDMARAAAEISEQLGTPHILVNNAGIGVVASYNTIELDSWRRILDVNLTGSFIACRTFLPGMVVNGWGRIVNVSSTSLYTNTPGMTAYIASKAGILGLTSALAAEVADSGVTVNAVSPGFTRTGMVQQSIDEGAMPPNVMDIVQMGQAIKKPTTPSDVAGAIVFLTGPTSGMITGQFLAADAGLTRHF